MTYAYPAWEFAADTCLLRLQRLQDKVLRTTGKFPRRTSVRDLYVAFRIPCVYDFSTALSGSKQMSFKIIIIQMFAIQEKAKPNTSKG
jgi:hypothetical protein